MTEDVTTLMATRRAIFVVGNSRSGTTMMGRVLGRHSAVFTFHELHFFEQLWDPRSAAMLARERAVELAARLLTIERDGYYTPGDWRAYAAEAARLLPEEVGAVPAPEVFMRVLCHEAARHGRSIPCDQTPRNLYYLDDILRLYPQARVIQMVRDPRDVVLSQKYRWRRRSLGGSAIPRREVVRSWANYHPITMGLLWRGGIQAGERFARHPRVMTLRFEDLLAAPEARVRALCEFLGLPFEPAMLDVPQVGSSHGADAPERRGLDPRAAGRWRRAQGHTGDLVVCQGVVRAAMLRHGYAPADLGPAWPHWLWAGITWPVKAGLAFLLNLGRARNVVAALRRRLGLAR
jgi:hypothetical protein